MLNFTHISPFVSHILFPLDIFLKGVYNLELRMEVVETFFL